VSASKIKETMMLEDPTVAVERIYRELYARLGHIATANDNQTIATIRSEYAKFRPHYPDELFEHLASISARHELAWDCATGNGQAAVGLARHFEKVIATDASAQQIESAEPDKRISYRVAPAEAS